MHDPWSHGRRTSPPPSPHRYPPDSPAMPHSMPHSILGDEPHEGNLYLMLGRLMGQFEHMMEDIAWIKGRLTEGESQFRATHSRIDKVETEIRQSPASRLKALMREIASPREWTGGAILAFLFVKGILNPDMIRDLIQWIIAKG